MTVKEFYDAVGGDYADAADRLKNDILITRFLKMITRDKNMHLLTEAVSMQDEEQAFYAVHTLKGIALNLSLTVFAEKCSYMTERLREQKYMPEDISQMYEAVKKEYDKVTGMLKELGLKH